MLDKLREFINKSPWLGWALFAAVLGIAVYMFVRGGKGTDPYSPERMQETVTIRFTDTDEVVEMTRGQLDKELRRRGDTVDPTKGITNPKTGAATGFLFDKGDWDEMVKRINEEKASIRATTGKSVKPVPRPEVHVEPPAAPPEGVPKK